MKKTYLFVNATVISIVVILILFSCNNDVSENIPDVKDQEVNKFIHSNTFKSHYFEILKYGEIDFDEIVSNTQTILEYTITSFVLPVKKNNKIVGYIESVDLLNTKFLPNGDKYAMNYVDLSKFDISSLSGEVKMIDLNYDSFTHSVIEVKDNVIESWASEGLSEELSEKYEDCRNPNKGSSLRAAHLCDGNKNGDVSFAECYKCLSDAINDNGLALFICEIPVAGWASCWTSKTGACIYISSAN